MMRNRTRTFATASRCKNQLKHLVVVIGLPLMTWGCGGTTSPTMLPARSFTLTGIVFERTPNGVQPVEGMWVADANSHAGALTDAKGFYRLAGLSAGSVTISASGKSFYVSTLTLTIDHDAVQDIEVVEVADHS